AGETSAGPAWFPPRQGFRFAFFTIPPSAPPPPELDMGAALSELQAKLPGMLEVLEPNEPGMHTTDTVDMVVILSGEAVLELDEGKEVTVRAGDCVVQNGTRHRWHNRSNVPCVTAVAMVGALRSGAPTATPTSGTRSA